MITTVEISDNEDSDDCVIKSVTFIVDDIPDTDFYRKVYNENQLLANFIEKCLRLENSTGMVRILQEGLLKYYYEADKSARESPRIQKNLRRANYLLHTDPSHKFTHIKDLCAIFKAIKVKKRVPFVTLSTNSDNANSTITVGDEIKKTHEKEKIDTHSNVPLSSTTVNNSFIISCETQDENTTMETCSQQSSIADEDKLLVPKKEAPFIPVTNKEKRLKVIESKIAHYQKQIAILDELEVEDDSLHSPYIKCERLKAKIVCLYKERCQLMGSQSVKRKGIRLKVIDGHPPGPTKALERFLNMNLNKDGYPPFPDFCDVVTCVTEANDKDELGWTKAQILNEASALFTLCGRALQKRRQNREYRDLVQQVKLEDLEKDPADVDPELMAKLEQNKKIAVKKESEILERYTMMQYLPTKKMTRKDATMETTDNKSGNEANLKLTAEQEFNNNSKESLSSPKREKKSHENVGVFQDKNKTTHEYTVYNEGNHSDSIHKIIKDDEKMDTAGYSNGVQNGDKKVISTGLNVEPLFKVTNVVDNNSTYNKSNKNIDLEKNKVNVMEKELLESNIPMQVDKKADKDLMSLFKIGKNFTLSVEIIDDN